jgi:hypothetical protein
MCVGRASPFQDGSLSRRAPSTKGNSLHNPLTIYPQTTGMKSITIVQRFGHRDPHRRRLLPGFWEYFWIGDNLQAAKAVAPNSFIARMAIG